MNRAIALLLCALLPCSLALSEKNKESIDELATNTDALYRSGTGAHDGAYTALSSSMLGWGVGLAIGIAILAAALHQSKASNNAHSTHCH